MNRLYEQIARIEGSNEKAALCTIIETQGSSPRKTGAKMLVFQNGAIEGTIGGGSLEKVVIAQALEALRNNAPVRVKHNLVSELAMCCGGTVELFIEPIMNRKKLYIFGAGHIGKALSGFAHALDFSVSLIDERYDAFEGFEHGEYTLRREHHATAIAGLPFDDQTLVVILTHNHAYDREILALTSKKPHLYIGMIGSERKVLVARKNLVSSGLMEEKEVEEIDMPIGVDIEAVTPQEIAISILAKLIDVRNKKQNPI
ncbi:MAG TPA: XdhC family protein [Bacteroidia bacterium]|nr:XdhC family protein [Bacteroidia bacterium]